jgi:hypothetical protein
VSAAADPYTRCSDCKFIGLPGSMDYSLTGPPPDGNVDWTRPGHVSCMICRARHDITAADVLQADATMVCKRCSASVTIRTALPASSAPDAGCSWSGTDSYPIAMRNSRARSPATPSKGRDGRRKEAAARPPGSSDIPSYTAALPRGRNRLDRAWNPAILSPGERKDSYYLLSSSACQAQIRSTG